MLNKTFFTYDQVLSRHSRAIAYYNYRGVVNHDRDINSSSPHSKYPIYLTISKDKVCFYLHYYTARKDNNDEQNKQLHHTNSPILTLSVEPASEIRDSLISTLQHIFLEIISLGTGSPQIVSAENKEKKNTSYSTLYAFSVEQRKQTRRDEKYICLRDLFLNFLYTAEHTQVFQASPSFNHIYRELSRNFLFRAIRNKAEYYYQRELCNECFNNGMNNAMNHGELQDIDQKRLVFQLAHFYNAERMWVSTITDPQSEKAFHYADGWMKHSNVELNDLFEPSKGNASLDGKSILAQFRRCKSPFVDKGKKQIEEYKKKHNDTENLALDWYLSKYQLGGFYRILFGKNWKLPNLLFHLLLGAFVTFFFVQNARMIEPWKYVFFFALALLAFIYPSIVWLASRKIKLTNVYFPRLLAAIIAAWCTMSVDDAIYTNFFDKEPSLFSDSQWKYVVMIAISFAMTLGFIYNELKKKNIFHCGFFILKRLTTIGLVAFFYSTIAGMFAMNYFAGDYIEKSGTLIDFYNSRVFTSNPDYIFDPSKVEKFTTDQLKTAIEKHDPQLLKQLVAMSIKNHGTQHQREPQAGSRTGESTCNDFTPKKTLQVLSILSSMQNSDLQGIRLYEAGSMADRLDRLRGRVSNASYTLDKVEQAKLDEFLQGGVDTSWIYLLKVLNEPKIYREALCELNPRGKPGVNNKIATKIFGVEIMHNLLYQFTILAMFFGIFVQSFFSEKSVVDPV